MSRLSYTALPQIKVYLLFVIVSLILTQKIIIVITIIGLLEQPCLEYVRTILKIKEHSIVSEAICYSCTYMSRNTPKLNQIYE